MPLNRATAAAKVGANHLRSLKLQRRQESRCGRALWRPRHSVAAAHVLPAGAEAWRAVVRPPSPPPWPCSSSARCSATSLFLIGIPGSPTRPWASTTWRRARTPTHPDIIIGSGLGTIRLQAAAHRVLPRHLRRHPIRSCAAAADPVSWCSWSSTLWSPPTPRRSPCRYSFAAMIMLYEGSLLISAGERISASSARTSSPRKRTVSARAGTDDRRHGRHGGGGPGSRGYAAARRESLHRRATEAVESCARVRLRGLAESDPFTQGAKLG